MKKFTTARSARFTAALYILAVAGTLSLANSCSKGGKGNRMCDKKHEQPAHNQAINSANSAISGTASRTQQTKDVTIASIRKTQDGTGSEIMFCQLAEIFTVYDASLITSLNTAFASSKSIKITFDPWRATVLAVEPATNDMSATMHRQATGEGLVYSMATTPTATLDEPSALGILNTTSAGLTNVIPDMTTAQMMFDYIAHQCCALPGPYTVDFCISFQYCEDGCYARAHKMCYVINNKYHYATHKIFSFANAGSDALSVKGEKWGGCCINWWYHVAPLVNIKTPTGTKAFVFDPAMFDQPVLLSAWLHAQENPACSGSAHVSMINIQPTTAYEPASYSGYLFNTDPMYADTDTTLVHYSPLLTCP